MASFNIRERGRVSVVDDAHRLHDVLLMHSPFAKDRPVGIVTFRTRFESHSQNSPSPRQPLYSTTTRTSPAFTVSPTIAATLTTRPAFADFNSFCIFMASIITTP